MISIFRKFNPFNALWLAVVLIVLRLGYVYSAPASIEFTFVELLVVYRANLHVAYLGSFFLSFGEDMPLHIGFT